MLKNYFKIALRNIVRQKTFSIISIAGLVLGLTSFLIIFLYVFNELSYDRFNGNYEKIFRVAGGSNNNGTRSIYARTPAPLADALKKEFPGIANTSRLAKEEKVLLSSGVKKFYEENVFFVDPSFLAIFTYPQIAGDRNNVLIEPMCVLLSESAADKYFGKTNSIGKTLRYNDKYDLIITGILKDAPANSHFHFDFLISMASTNQIYGSDFATNRMNTSVYTYLLLNRPEYAQQIERKFPSFLKNYYGGLLDFIEPTLTLQPLSQIHLYSNIGGEIEVNSDIKYIYIFSVVGLMILIMACINYMNILTAGYSKRIKEIGVRKVLGANKAVLIKQFIGESILTAFLAFFIAIIISFLFLPVINSLIGQALILDIRQNYELIITMVIVTLLTGIISGIYPAFILSSLNPSTILGKSLHGKFSGAFVIRTLIVFQFMISTGLIISTLIISEQLNYIRNKKLGFEKNHIVVLPLREDYTRKNYEMLKNALVQKPKILSASASSVLPGEVKYYNSVSWDGSGYDKTMDFIFADYNFLKTYEIDIAQGRDFSKDFGSDLKSGYILNEEAVKEIGWNEPIGKKFNDGLVIGIVKNFHYKSLYEPVKPLYISVNPDNINFLSIRINPKNVTASLDYIQQSWKELFPHSPFEYFFFNNHLDKLYKSETKLASIFNWFSGLTIMISCLGLIGLTSISVVNKNKEIGIRKVLGESVEGIVFMITKEFIIIIFVANIIAWPVAYYFMSKWLEDFAYRIEISWLIFVLSGLIVLLIALVTVGYQAIKAAVANPVESLRYE